MPFAMLMIFGMAAVAGVRYGWKGPAAELSPATDPIIIYCRRTITTSVPKYRADAKAYFDAIHSLYPDEYYGFSYMDPDKTNVAHQLFWFGGTTFFDHKTIRELDKPNADIWSNYSPEGTDNCWVFGGWIEPMKGIDFPAGVSYHFVENEGGGLAMNSMTMDSEAIAILCERTVTTSVDKYVKDAATYMHAIAEYEPEYSGFSYMDAETPNKAWQLFYFGGQSFFHHKTLRELDQANADIWSNYSPEGKDNCYVFGGWIDPMLNIDFPLGVSYHFSPRDSGSILH
jgi:hypothetical protein